jgi:tetratricopeptide (TPR) repeat protein
MDLFHNVVSLEYHAQAAYDAGLYQDAGLLRSRAVSIAQYLGQPQLLAVLCRRLGDSLKADRALLDAVVAYEAGLRAFLALPINIEYMLVSFQTLGPYFYRLDRMPLPEHHDDSTAQSLQIAVADTFLPAALLLECAELYEQQSSIHLALHTYKRVLPYLMGDQTLELRVKTLAHLGTIAYQQGEITTVETTLRELLELRENTSDLQALCHILPALGSLYEALGNVPYALDMYRQTLKYCLISGDPAAIGNARGRLTRLTTQQLRAQRAARMAHARMLEPVNPPLESSVGAEIRQQKIVQKRLVGDHVFRDETNF